MHVYRDTYRKTRLDRKSEKRVATGKRLPCKRWMIELRDHRERRLRLPGFTDEKSSIVLGKKLEALAELRRCGEPLTQALSLWLSTQASDALKKRLARAGLLDERWVEGDRPLEAHLLAFESSLLDRRRTAAHVGTTLSRIQAVLNATKAAHFTDISAEKVERYLSDRRAGGLSVRSSNAYLQAVQQFTRWLVRTGRAAEDPLRILRALNGAGERRLERRAAKFEDELARIIRATATGPSYRGVPGPTRALVYTLAAQTGIRVSELCALRVGDFELDSDHPRVTLREGTTKNRRGMTLDLLPATARDLRRVVQGLPMAPAFGLPSAFRKRAAEWLRSDLALAGVPFEDESGRRLDFHALRTSFVTALARAGASPAATQRLARHSTPSLTFNVYAKLGSDDDRRALELLPTLPSAFEREDASVQATGTDPKSVHAPGPGPGITPGLSGTSLDVHPTSRVQEGRSDGAKVAEWQTRWIQNPFPERE